MIPSTTEESKEFLNKKIRRYGATVYAKIDLDWAGRAIKVLEHAPDIQVLDSPKEHPSEPGIKKIIMRSLNFPRYWDNQEVDLYGDVSKGRLILYHPAGLEKDIPEDFNYDKEKKYPTQKEKDWEDYDNTEPDYD
jgi:hypothetical protein